VSVFGHKPAAYFETGDGEHTWSGEQRQCVHCQFTWEYRPGSGITRGYCLRCNGFVCGRPECEAMQKRMLADFAHRGNSTDRHCIPYTDWIERLRDEFARDPRYQVTQGGIVIATG
jgi:hypothetical protein